MKKTNPPRRPAQSRPPLSGLPPPPGSATPDVPPRPGRGPQPGPRARLTAADPAEVERHVAAINQGIAALDRLLVLVSGDPDERPPPGPVQGDGADRDAWLGEPRWGARAASFCETVADSIEEHPALFEPLPFSGATVRGQLRLCGRMDLFLQRLDRARPALAAALLRHRADLLSRCSAALVQGEVPLRKPFLPAEERRLIEQVTGPARALLLELERPPDAGLRDDELLETDLGADGDWGRDLTLEMDLELGGPDPILDEEVARLGYQALVDHAEEELADVLLRKLGTRGRLARPDPKDRKPN